MGYLYEELVRRFSELSNETAGEHFTPREVIRLMVDLLFIEDDEAVDPVRVTEEMDIANSLRKSIERLPEREGHILGLRYGFLDGVPRTLEEIGEEFNLTRERIRQLEKLALCRLRHPSFGIREQDLI